jgi:hypothetical protein
MQGVQEMLKHYTLTVMLAGFLVACGKPPAPTVAQYLHDVDTMNEVVKVGRNDPAKYKDDPAYINAEHAAATVFTGAFIACWKDKKVTTQNTDHACLDKEGFKR